MGTDTSTSTGTCGADTLAIDFSTHTRVSHVNDIHVTLLYCQSCKNTLILCRAILTLPFLTSSLIGTYDFHHTLLLFVLPFLSFSLGAICVRS